MKQLATLLLALVATISTAQVGINTTNPQATLHVAGDAIIDSLPYVLEGTLVVADSLNRLRSFCGPNCALKINLGPDGKIRFIRIINGPVRRVDTLQLVNN